MSLESAQRPLFVGPDLAMFCSPRTLNVPVIPEAEVLGFTAAPVHNYIPVDPDFHVSHGSRGPDFCNVTITLTHPGGEDTVFVSIWLPRHGWNGRYQATGGGGLAVGHDLAMYQPVLNGYASSSTDGGLTLKHTVDPQLGSWALHKNGTLNEPLLVNIGWRAIHDAAVASKSIIRQFYGIDPHYSYYTGCSQGGRQGYAAAAKYPGDFDGILAVAPAINADYVGPLDFWPAVAMRNEHETPPFCVFEAYQRAITAECDPLDGVADGFISDWDVLTSCPYNPDTLIGASVPCEAISANVTITPAHAKLVSMILDGPLNESGNPVWWGLAPGAAFSTTAKTVRNDDGVWTPDPFVPGAACLKYMSLRDPDYDLTNMSYPDFFRGFEASRAGMGKYFGSEWLDFAGFQAAGGKLLSWVGLADECIPPSNVLDFRDHVEKVFGSADNTDQFYRLFTAPGVAHCQGGAGPQPLDAFGALMDWVENHNAPEFLQARIENQDGHEITRSLCRYPRKLVYKTGNVDKADSFECE
ncbi:hypothetical protein AOCH_001140 [Aspergillus ochraceoroseus]|uniref:Carboxylic ester hydrolase n=1 Tax=Aspergillus ochraceoroseus TaxID=138278 RepID=A0A0F8WYZ1_9EURO|nr:hypothetical protein AOCH_001140 [Aspergillus ochraceoroseus]